ncbi:MAG: outer membrane lipoprotein chaperone LolA [Gammaproteobacteria bacterium]|nr:outer membrane lipoprotein chaperone LolA [Gammaproteobacteria bacterium]
MKLRTITLVLALTLSMASAAGAPDTDPGEKLVDAFVTDVKTLSSRFEQRLMDANGEILEVSSGTLDIHRPSQFRWAYDEPYEQWLVADGTNIWNYDIDLAQVTVKPQVEALANTPALLLGGSETAMDEFEFDGSYEAGGLTWVRMRPIDTESGFKRVELAFNDRELARMVFLDNLEQTTLVSLYEVIVNESIDASQFEFVVPEDVDVVGTPSTADLKNTTTDNTDIP